MDNNVDYKNTLNLPKTDFEMRAGLAAKEPRILAKWQERKLYEEILASRAKAPSFVLHDGPPYANGHLHQGHILNKILKDIVVKDRTMAGFATAYVPGWDCHGLPIEVQVDKELGAKKSTMNKAEVRAACREYAQKFVDIQAQEFQRLGVLGRFDAPYKTMNYGYEATTLRELARFAENGLLYKGLRPVNWCCVHQTALAEAEVEYEDHVSPSVFVAFEATTLPPRWAGKLPLDWVIWTTTPWTLPANVAICLNPNLEYVAYPVRGRLRLVARGLLESFLNAVGAEPYDAQLVQGQWLGKELEGLNYRHPLFDRESPIILGEHVTLEAGTGCVHTATGHGAEDFEVGRKYGLPVVSPVDSRGCLTDKAGPFAGLFVFDANPKIAAALAEKGALLNRQGETVCHRYAHCWRCHKPIILRATEQWWVAMDRPFAGGGTLRERALEALKQVRWIPSWGEDRIYGMLATRPDWCLSRQRTWGVPIAVIYCDKCDHAIVDPVLMNRVADAFEREGADAWFTRSVRDLVGEQQCPECHHTEFRKENDILDVWFDSGVSYSAVIEREGLGHREGPPVDLYLEGSDQHRGWFHSSLLCSLGTRARPPFRAVLTHGFVVDGQGKKISKSKGNFVDPFKTIAQDGAEVLRLWVASEDYREDIRVSSEILTRLADNYRKIRNTVRFLLGNLEDFDPNRDMLPFANLEELDAYILGVVDKSVARMRKAYSDYAFHTVMQTLTELCTVDLSSFYLDVIKDRCYASAPGSERRRSAQTAVYLITRDLLRLMAPIFAFTAEEAWSHLRHLDGDPTSIHLAYYPGLYEPQNIALLKAQTEVAWESFRPRFEAVRELRKAVNLRLEEARRAKLLGASVEALVSITADADLYSQLSHIGTDKLAEYLIVSGVKLIPGTAGLLVEVAKSDGTKCERCWLYCHDIGAITAHPTICKRCGEALT